MFAGRGGTIKPVIACVDVDYKNGGAVCACLWFKHWPDAQARGQSVVRLAHVEPYEPGAFYRRELPCILRVIEDAQKYDRFGEILDAIVVDGHVWLDAAHRPGLGARLFDALGGKVPIVGVAKTMFKDTDAAVQAGAAAYVLRGKSAKPLIVSAAGMDLNAAIQGIEKMHGDYRVPALLKAVDHLCRHG